MAKRSNYKPVTVYSDCTSSASEEESESTPLPPLLQDDALSKNEVAIEIKPIPDATEAHMRHEGSSPSASIITTHCGVGTKSECMHVEDCPILDALDDVILKFLDTNVVIGTEVKWCGQYHPRRPFSTGFVLGEENK